MPDWLWFLRCKFTCAFPTAGLQTTQPYAHKMLQETLEKGSCLLHLRFYLLWPLV